MNVHVRLFAGSALASLAALALVGAPLAAQSAQFGSDAGASAFAAVGVMPTGLAGQLGSVPRDSASATTTPASASAPTLRGPSTSSARVAAHAISTSRGAPPVFQNKKSKNSVALMIVGGAALVVGAVIGDDAGTLVMLGGAAVGLYGLYLFLT
jgi:hypothetical protein